MTLSFTFAKISKCRNFTLHGPTKCQVDYPVQNAGGIDAKTPRPYGVAKGITGGRRQEQQNRKCIYGFVVASSVSPYNLRSALRKFSRELRSNSR
jgi:hypothetical protein